MSSASLPRLPRGEESLRLALEHEREHLGLDLRQAAPALMKRGALSTIALGLACVAIGSGTAWGFSAPMPLSEAVGDTDATLSWRFKAFYDEAAGYAPDRCTRASDSSFHCRVGWVTGDYDFFGQVTPYYSSEGPDGTNYWNAGYKITRFNEYCAAVAHLPKRRCVRHYRGAY